MRQAGFTLVEVIVVTVLIAILGIASFSYLGFGAQIFRDTVERDQLAAQSRFAIERFTREIRHALPGSPRVSGDNACIEFVPVISGGVYFALPSSGNSTLSLSKPRLASERLSSLEPPYFIYIAANTAQRVYAPDASQRVMVDLSEAPLPTAEGVAWELDISSASFRRSSPGRRYYLTSSPVSWCIAGATSTSAELRRYSGYNPMFSLDSPGHSRSVMSAPSAEEIESKATEINFNRSTMAVSLNAEQSDFTELSPTLTRNNLILVNLTFHNSAGTESMTLYHEVHIPNVP